MAYLPEFAELINQALARLDRSPSWLAQRIDVNPSTVSRWLNQGARPGDPEIVVRVADVLGMAGRVQELLTAAGYGYVALEGQERAPSPNRQRANVNLPAALTPFLGRARELAALAALLADPQTRLVSIVGPGGMGKTRLAVEGALRAQESYPDGVCFVALAPLHGAEDIAPAMADALGFTLQSDPRTPHQQLCDYLREKSLLLLLDNFEHLLEGAGLIFDILQAAPRVKALVTSRERLGLSGEQVYLLEGMEFPAQETDARGEAYGAVQLFAQSARFAQPDFVLQPEEVAAVVRICRAVEGAPLGIVLAAAWVKMLSLPEIAAEIERSLDFLAADLRDLPERQRSLRAVFDHSWRLLGEEERRVLRQMSIFCGGFTRQAAQEVLEADLPLLTGLLNKSLLQRTETGRHELHELVRQYAAEKLTQDPQAEVRRERHARYYLNLLHQQMEDLSGRQLRARLGAVSAELENIRTGWAWAAEQGSAALVGTVLPDLCNFYEWLGRYAQGAAVCRTGAQTAQAAQDARGEVNARIREANFRRILGDQAEARRLLEERASALALLSQSGEDIRWERAGLALGLAHLAMDAGDGPAAKERFEESIALYEEVDDLRALARTLGEFSYVLRNLENISDKAQEQWLENMQAARRSIAISRQIGYPIGLAEGLLQLSTSIRDFDEAEEMMQESLDLYTEMGIDSGIAAAECQIGFLKLLQGRHEECHRINLRALQAARNSGNLSLVARSFLHLGMGQLATQGYVQAKHFLEQSVAAYRTAGVQHHLALSIGYLGYAERGLGNHSAARRCIAQALRMGLACQSAQPLRLGHRSQVKVK